MSNIEIGDKKPSLLIENCPWYYKEYKKDPTVKAMLAMMDHIDMLYNLENANNEEFLSRLEKLKFYAFPLNKYKLTEDLYIKMNARGKQLSGYENFKADLINWMKSKDNPDSVDFAKDVTYRSRKMKYYMAFAQKMDNEWTDIFWNAIKATRDTETSLDGKVVDGMFMRFFIRFFFNERILHLQKTTDLADEVIANDEIVKYFYGENGNDINVTYNNNVFEDKYQVCLSYEVIHKIEIFLDGIIGKLDIINREFVPSWLRETKSKDDSFYSQKISWQGRVVFHAAFKYFTLNAFNETAYCDWIKMVWNFVVDPTIRNIKDNIGTLRFIDDLSEHSDNIIDWMAKTTEGSRLKTQFVEEHVKAQLVKIDSEWRTLLTEAEKHHLLKGRIMFLLPEKENTDKKKFKKQLEITRCLIPDNYNDYLWIRAILSQINEYNITAGSLTLSNVRENWKTSISDNLMIPMQSLLSMISVHLEENGLEASTSVIRQYVQELCSNYEAKDGLEWIFPLVSWHNNDWSLLGGYSDSRKIEERDGNVYLCYKTTLQPESCILLTSSRDKIISRILPYTDKKFEWIYTSYHCNIQDTFFRGMNVTLFRDIDVEAIGNLKCVYIFDPKRVIVGIRYTDNPVIADEENRTIWACSRIFDISEICSNDDINIIVEQIENEVFNNENPDSLLSLAQCNNWQNDIIEETSEEATTTERGLTIIFPDKTVFKNRNAIEAFKLALEKIGLEEISNREDLKHSGYNLVGKTQRPPVPGRTWQHLYKGWFIYSNISNDDKRDDLTILCPDIKVLDGVQDVDEIEDINN